MSNLLTAREKELIESLYINGTSAKKIHALLDRSYGAINSYIKKHNLEEIKNAKKVGRASLLKGAMMELDYIISQSRDRGYEPDPEHTRLRAQLIKEIEVLKDLPLSATLEVVEKMLIYFTENIEMKQVKMLNKYIQMFVKHEAGKS